MTALVERTQLSLMQEFNTVLAMRYLTLVGFALLVQDHIYTFRDEVSLVWRTPGSFGKYIFLLNRYLVPSCLVPMLVVVAGFDGTHYEDATCQRVILIVSVLGITSLGIANLIVLQRVRILWDGDATISRLLGVGFLISFSASFALNLIATLRVVPGARFDPLVNQCVITHTTRILPAAWAAPMIFELIVLTATIMNALSRPRTANEALSQALRRDGITFFLTLTCLRALNLGLSASLDPALSVVCFYFVWAMITIVLNRSVLRLRRMEMEMLMPLMDRPEVTNTSRHRHAHSSYSQGDVGGILELGRTTPLDYARSDIKSQDTHESRSPTWDLK